MDTRTILILGGAAAVGAFFLGYLCKPFGLCPGANPLAGPNPGGNKAQDPNLGNYYANPVSTPVSRAVAKDPSQQGLLNSFANPSASDLANSKVGYSYVGYTSAPLTVA